MRKIIGIILANFFSIILIVQVAYAKDFDKIPLTGPLTNPITIPITSPLFITGNVTIHKLGRLFDNFLRFVPGVGITITATDLLHRTISTSTTTDANGHYILPVPKNSLYTVIAHDTKGTFFVPPVHVVHVKNNNPKADFQGLTF